MLWSDSNLCICMKENILKLRKQGKSYREIQKILGCSKATIAYHCTDGQKEKARVSRITLRKTNRTKLKEKFGGQCTICGYNRCLDALDFHHINGNDKSNNVNFVLQRHGFNAAVLEAQQCQLVCSNCHREIHCNNEQRMKYGQRNGTRTT